MNEEEYARILAESQSMDSSSRSALSVAQMQDLAVSLEEKEKGLVELQLDVDSILNQCFHLLRQDIFTINSKTGNIEWKEIEREKRVLTDEGVDSIMQILRFYINKNNLLSNLEDEKINKLMYRFMTELNDLLFLKYHIMFPLPTEEEIDKEFNRLFSKKQVNEEEREIIRRNLFYELFREKLYEAGMLVAKLEVIVYTTLSRAWRGEERGSIRRHSMVAEFMGNRNLDINNVKKQSGLFKMFS
ncbi:MAG: hypothetical protein KatS3mg096_715 [Candidatus Parcubacteria bacterium]|nr:MAG: hypothetical protein KatS3mg096_688 [Candidatus Parcubacteria bacterium]GIW67847.1 MAG: hypothetical protein KatS3mg096_715 [Candidatus Parcubacteria bacterium]